VDPDRVAVAGHSSGGALAVSVALAARDRGGRSIAFMYLGYPVLDDRQETPSSKAMTDPRLWNRDTAVHTWELYLQGIDPLSGYAVPGRCEDVSGLPPTYFMVAALDPSRDEALDLADRMVSAGGPWSSISSPECRTVSTSSSPMPLSPEGRCPPGLRHWRMVSGPCEDPREEYQVSTNTLGRGPVTG
jgi:acetyl esterase/lipase